MGWGVDFSADIFLSKQNYNKNIYQVQEMIDQYNRGLEEHKASILMYCSANLKDVVPEEWKDDSIEWLRDFINDKFEQIDTLNKDILKLEYYKEYLEKEQKK